MDLLQRFEEHIKKQGLFQKKDKLLLAVSGGVDSVVLCELCKQAGYDFSIAHCNFQLRGEESERDEAFVRKLAEGYGVPVEVKKFGTEQYASENKLSVQEAARELRYQWFKELLPAQGSKLRAFLLTAHHSDDNTETLLMNFFRGTGLHGLTGIPARAGYTRRPLLSFSKEELIEFARLRNLAFVEDSSNYSSKYTRNFFRNELLPALGKVYPQVNENLLDNIGRFTEIENLYRFLLEGLKKKLCREKGGEVHIPVKQLMGFRNRALIYEIISAYGFNEKQVDEVVKLSGSESGKYIVSPSRRYQLFRHRHWFIISPVRSQETENILLEKDDSEISFPGGKLRLTTSLVPASLSNSAQTACLDAREISFPLLLRKWKAGDYFYPLGMTKKKKLSRFLIDQKLSRTEKETVWVLESNRRIAWILGLRIDERFKVTGKTKEVLNLNFLPA